MRLTRHIFIGTMLSIITFFSVSFLTILLQISPLSHYTDKSRFRLEIGFPFVYYEQFWLRGNDFPNTGWLRSSLIYDIFLTWISVIALYLIMQHLKYRMSK